MTSPLAAIGRWLPRGWGDLARQIGLFVLVDLCYEIVRGFADGKAQVAIAHGQQVIDLERGLGTFFEPGMQAFFTPAEWVIEIANQIYLNSQFSITIGFLVWVYLFRNDAFYFVRNLLMVGMGLALIGYIGFPTAPPRMFPDYGFVDTVNAHSSVNHDSALAKLFINPYAAIPSLHCAFALMVGFSGVNVCRRLAPKIFWAVWPAIVIWVVIVTANHFWVDAALGGLVALCSYLICSRLLAPARPERWAWRYESEPERAGA